MLDIEGVVNIDKYLSIGLLINIQGMLYFWWREVIVEQVDRILFEKKLENSLQSLF